MAGPVKCAREIGTPQSCAHPRMLAVCSVLPGIEPTDKVRANFVVCLIGLKVGLRSVTCGGPSRQLNLTSRRQKVTDSSDRGPYRIIGDGPKGQKRCCHSKMTCEIPCSNLISRGLACQPRSARYGQRSSPGASMSACLNMYRARPLQRWSTRAARGLRQVPFIQESLISHAYTSSYSWSNSRQSANARLQSLRVEAQGGPYPGSRISETPEGRSQKFAASAPHEINVFREILRSEEGPRFLITCRYCAIAGCHDRGMVCSDLAAPLNRRETMAGHALPKGQSTGFRIDIKKLRRHGTEKYDGPVISSRQARRSARQSSPQKLVAEIKS
jgi:hypothetical protein